MHELIIDVSKWNFPVDYPLLKAEGVQAILVKSGGSGYDDPKAAIHVAQVKAAGLHLGLYYWIDPLCDGQTQAGHLNRQIAMWKPDFVVGDNEQWWADWDKWYQFRMGERPASDVPVIPPRQIDRVARNFFANVQHINRMHYTSTGFISTYTPNSKAWINDYALHLAQYHKTGGDWLRHKITWDDSGQSISRRPCQPSRWAGPSPSCGSGVGIA